MIVIFNLFQIFQSYRVLEIVEKFIRIGNNICLGILGYEDWQETGDNREEP